MDIWHIVYDDLTRQGSQFEWTAIDAFNFRDDFITKESMDDLRTWAHVEMMM